MIRVLIGDLFDSSAQTLVNTVNCEGVMGKGIALEFKRRFPDMFADYQARCARGEVKLGRPYLYRPLVPPWILNFPTKDRWRSVTRLDDITRGLEYLLTNYEAWGLTSIAVPPLGCGNGQLEWRVVGPTLYRHLSRMNIPVELYAPYGTPHEELQPSFLDQRGPQAVAQHPMPKPAFVQPGWIALVDILRRVEEQPYHWPVGRTTFQKLAYVATEEGVPTGLQFKAGSYGPFAQGLKAIETRLANNGLVTEGRLGRMLEVRVGPTFPDARKAYEADLRRFEETLDRVADLFTRMNTAQAEITATVLFAANQLSRGVANKPTEMQVFNAVMSWKERRRPPLKEDQVALTIRQLAALGWLRVSASRDLPVPEEELADA